MIPFVQQPVPDSTNVRGSASTYAACVFAACASLLRWAPSERVTVFSDRPWRFPLPPNAHSEVVPFVSRPPQDLWSHFQSAHYLLDAVGRCAKDGRREVVAFIDPDVLFLRPPQAILESVTLGDFGVIRLPTRPQEPINGLSRKEAWQLHHLASHPNCSESLPAPHLGGELIVCSPESLGPLASQMRTGMVRSIERRGANAWPWFTTEEHLLSFATCDGRVVDLGDVARRIWTTIRCRDQSIHDLDLEMLHLPSEKDGGLPGIASAALDKRSWFWTQDDGEWRGWVARLTSVGRAPSLGLIHAVARRLHPTPAPPAF